MPVPAGCPGIMVGPHDHLLIQQPWCCSVPGAHADMHYSALLDWGMLHIGPMRLPVV